MGLSTFKNLLTGFSRHKLKSKHVNKFQDYLNEPTNWLNDKKPMPFFSNMIVAHILANQIMIKLEGKILWSLTELALLTKRFSCWTWADRCEAHGSSRSSWKSPEVLLARKLGNQTWQITWWWVISHTNQNIRFTQWTRPNFNTDTPLPQRDDDQKRKD